MTNRPQPTREMEAKLNELTAKLKALNLTVTKVDDAVTEREKESLKRIEASLTKKINGIYDLKEEIEELKFINKESDDDVQAWATETENKLNDAKGKIERVKRALSDIENDETITEREKDEAIRREVIKAETEKQVAIEKVRMELERIHKEEERKRDLEHQDLILQQQMKFEKARESNVEKPKELQVKNVKLPKLSITKFSGKFSDWLSFWNTFEVEIDSTELPTVSKFAYLRELLEPNVRSEDRGFAFQYRRIRKSEEHS